MYIEIHIPHSPSCSLLTNSCDGYQATVTFKYHSMHISNMMNEDTLEIPYEILRSTKDDETIAFYWGECKIGMQERLKDKSVDVVITSPPYNIGIDRFL